MSVISPLLRLEFPSSKAQSSSIMSFLSSYSRLKKMEVDREEAEEGLKEHKENGGEKQKTSDEPDGCSGIQKSVQMEHPKDGHWSSEYLSPKELQKLHFSEQQQENYQTGKEESGFGSQGTSPQQRGGEGSHQDSSQGEDLRHLPGEQGRLLTSLVSSHGTEPKQPREIREYCHRRCHRGGRAHYARDISITQVAMADDDNISALQQVTKGGAAAMTLASKWQVSFDNSEETDNEMEGKDNLTSPEHRPIIHESPTRLLSDHCPTPPPPSTFWPPMPEASFAPQVEKSNIIHEEAICQNVFSPRKVLRPPIEFIPKFDENRNLKGNLNCRNRRRPVRQTVSQPIKLTCDSITPLFEIEEYDLKDDPVTSRFPELSEDHSCIQRVWSCPDITISPSPLVDSPMRQHNSETNINEMGITREQVVGEEETAYKSDRKDALPPTSLHADLEEKKLVSSRRHSAEMILPSTEDQLSLGEDIRDTGSRRKIGKTNYQKQPGSIYPVQHLDNESTLETDCARKKKIFFMLQPRRMFTLKNKGTKIIRPSRFFYKNSVWNLNRHCRDATEATWQQFVGKEAPRRSEKEDILPSTSLHEELEVENLVSSRCHSTESNLKDIRDTGTRRKVGKTTYKKQPGTKERQKKQKGTDAQTSDQIPSRSISPRPKSILKKSGSDQPLSFLNKEEDTRSVNNKLIVTSVEWKDDKKIGTVVKLEVESPTLERQSPLTPVTEITKLHQDEPSVYFDAPQPDEEDSVNEIQDVGKEGSNKEKTEGPDEKEFKTPPKEQNDDQQQLSTMTKISGKETPHRSEKEDVLPSTSLHEELEGENFVSLRCHSTEINLKDIRDTGTRRKVGKTTYKKQPGTKERQKKQKGTDAQTSDQIPSCSISQHPKSILKKSGSDQPLSFLNNYEDTRSVNNKLIVTSVEWKDDKKIGTVVKLEVESPTLERQSPLTPVTEITKLHQDEPSVYFDAPQPDEEDSVNEIQDVGKEGSNKEKTEGPDEEEFKTPPKEQNDDQQQLSTMTKISEMCTTPLDLSRQTPSPTGFKQPSQQSASKMFQDPDSGIPNISEVCETDNLPIGVLQDSVTQTSTEFNMHAQAAECNDDVMASSIPVQYLGTHRESTPETDSDSGKQGREGQRYAVRPIKPFVLKNERLRPSSMAEANTLSTRPSLPSYRDSSRSPNRRLFCHPAPDVNEWKNGGKYASSPNISSDALYINRNRSYNLRTDSTENLHISGAHTAPNSRSASSSREESENFEVPNRSNVPNSKPSDLYMRSIRWDKKLKKAKSPISPRRDDLFDECCSRFAYVEEVIFRWIREGVPRVPHVPAQIPMPLFREHVKDLERRGLRHSQTVGSVDHNPSDISSARKGSLTSKGNEKVCVQRDIHPVSSSLPALQREMNYLDDPVFKEDKAAISKIKSDSMADRMILHERETTKEQESAEKEKLAENQKRVKKTLVQKLKEVDPHPDMKKHVEQLKMLREARNLRQKEYEKELEGMKSRVQKQPLLVERQSQKHKKSEKPPLDETSDDDDDDTETSDDDDDDTVSKYSGDVSKK